MKEYYCLGTFKYAQLSALHSTFTILILGVRSLDKNGQGEQDSCLPA
jgi:hypothetical protein